MPTAPEKPPQIPALTDPAKMGPAMRALSTSKRAFVDAKMANPHIDNSRAAMLAGYSHKGVSVAGWRLAHDDGVIAAIHEESFRRLRNMVPLALDRLEQVLRDESKDATKVAFGILDRGGLPVHTEQKVTVEKNENQGEQVERIIRLAKLLGQDPRLLLGQYGITMADAPVLRTAAPVLDAEFMEVASSTEGLEDIL